MNIVELRKKATELKIPGRSKARTKAALEELIRVFEKEKEKPNTATEEETAETAEAAEEGDEEEEEEEEEMAEEAEEAEKLMVAERNQARKRNFNKWVKDDKKVKHDPYETVSSLLFGIRRKEEEDETEDETEKEENKEEKKIEKQNQQKETSKKLGKEEEEEVDFIQRCLFEDEPDKTADEKKEEREMVIKFLYETDKEETKEENEKQKNRG